MRSSTYETQDSLLSLNNLSLQTDGSKDFVTMIQYEIRSGMRNVLLVQNYVRSRHRVCLSSHFHGSDSSLLAACRFLIDYMTHNMHNEHMVD